MNAIIFDTETNGKPKNYKLPAKYVDNWPRITQLAWRKINVETEEVISEHQSLILPDGWTIPTVEEQIAAGEKNPNFFVENNMSTERCFEEGSPIAEVLAKLVEDMNDSEFIVAHNMAFDENVVGAEMIRLDMTAKRLVKICTMNSSTKYCGLFNRFTRRNDKWPTLQELHVKLFGVEFVGAHDAMDDVIACANSFLELIKKGVIFLPKG